MSQHSLSAVLTRARSGLAVPSGQLLLASGFVALALMLNRHGHYDPVAILMATAAVALSLRAARRARALAPAASPAAETGDREGRALIGCMLVVFLVYSAGFELVMRERGPGQWLFLASAAAVLALELRDLGGATPRPARRARLAALLLCTAVAGAVQIRTSDASFIDVWTLQQDALTALRQGQNPYSIRYRNIYGDMRFYAPETADARWVYGFPYVPQMVLLDAPSYALGGDVRYTMLAALLVAAWAAARLAPAELGVLAALGVVLHPSSIHVVRNSWTEPPALAAALLLLLALRRFQRAPPKGWLAAGAAGAFFAGSKQFALLPLVPLLPTLPRPGRVRALATGALLAGAVLAPFVYWDPAGLWNGTVMIHFHQPFRPDSLCWQGLLGHLGLGPLPPWLGFGLSAAALAFTWPRRGSLAQGATCGAAAFLVFVMSAKYAAVNYLWFAGGLLFAAGLLQRADER
jgi:hypothetical protein